MQLGINLAGAPYGLLTTTASVDYFASKGFSTIRLPLAWEQLQPTLNGSLDPDFMAQVHQFVSYAESQGMHVILDVHSYGSYNGDLIGSDSVPATAFADLWGKLASSFATDSNVSFGLMNEPLLPTASAWLPVVNAAIESIRDAGATTQQVLVSGTYWDGGSTWTQTDNASVLGKPGAIVDPSNNIAFEVHQYLDDTSGQHSWVVSETIGVERLTDITEWARQTGAKLYLGEFGVADNTTSLVALTNMLNFVSQNSDVWEGASYWAAGTGWHDYMYSVEPNLGILDMPQMSVLENYTNSNVVSKVLSDGTVELMTYVNGRSDASIKDILDAHGDLLSRTLYNADGTLSRSVTVDAQGNFDLSIYSDSSDHPTSLEVYSSSYGLESRTSFSDDGSKTTITYGANEWDIRKTETYTKDGLPASASEITANGGHQNTTYVDGHVSVVEQYDANWKFVSRSSYDASGNLDAVQSSDANGQSTITHYGTDGKTITASELYDANWKMISSTTYDAKGVVEQVITNLDDGSRRVDQYATNGQSVAESTTYDATGSVVSKSIAGADGSRTIESFAAGTSVLTKSETYDSDWHLLSRTSYDSHGNISGVQTDLKDGTHTIATYAAGAANPSSIATYDASWQITSTTQIDSAGHVSAIDRVSADGTHTIESFAAGSTQATQVTQSETYDSAWNLVSRTSYDSHGNISGVQTDLKDGTHTIATYAAGAANPSSIATYDASWQIIANTQIDSAGHVSAIDHINPDGTHTVQSFAAGSTQATQATQSETYDSAWNLVSRTSYDSHGNVSGVQTDLKDGTHTVATYAAGAATPSSIATYDAAWHMIANAQLDSAGRVSTIDHIAADGTHTIETVAASTTSTTGTTTAAPAAPGVVLAHDTGTGGSHVTSDGLITYTPATSGDTLHFRLDNGSVSSAAPTLATDGSADGQHTITVYETNAAGLSSAATSLVFTLDTHHTATGTTTGTQTTTTGTGTTATGTTGTGATGTDTTTSSSGTSQSGSTTGTGGTSASSGTTATAPGAPGVVLAHDTGTGGSHVTSDGLITYTPATSGDTLHFRLDNGSVSSAAPTLATDGSADGQHTITVYETNAAGLSSVETSLVFTLDTHHATSGVHVA